MLFDTFICSRFQKSQKYCILRIFKNVLEHELFSYRVIRPNVDKCLFKYLNKYTRKDENILQRTQLET